jgi:hypothetical protein
MLTSGLHAVATRDTTDLKEVDQQSAMIAIRTRAAHENITAP